MKPCSLGGQSAQGSNGEISCSSGSLVHLAGLGVASGVLVLAPLVWLVALPFRIVGLCFGAVFALLRTLLFLPARVLGYRG